MIWLQGEELHSTSIMDDDHGDGHDRDGNVANAFFFCIFEQALVLDSTFCNPGTVKPDDQRFFLFIIVFAACILPILLILQLQRTLSVRRIENWAAMRYAIKFGSKEDRFTLQFYNATTLRCNCCRLEIAPAP